MQPHLWPYLAPFLSHNQLDTQFSAVGLAQIKMIIYDQNQKMIDNPTLDLREDDPLI